MPEHARLTDGTSKKPRRTMHWKEISSSFEDGSSGRILKAGVEDAIRFYNVIRIHHSLGYRTPIEVYQQSQMS